MMKVKDLLPRAEARHVIPTIVDHRNRKSSMKQALKLSVLPSSYLKYVCFLVLKYIFITPSRNVDLIKCFFF